MSTKPRQPDCPQLDAALESKMRGVASRMRRYVFTTGAAHVVGVLFAGCAIQLAVDWGLRGLRWDMRCTLLIAILVVVARQTWLRLLRPWRKRIELADVACLVERRYPALGSSLISAVRFAAGDVGPGRSNSPDMAASVVRRAAERTANLDFDAVLDSRSARRGVTSVVTLAAIVVVSFIVAAPVMRLWFVRNILLLDEPWPKQTTLVVSGDDRSIFGAKGDDIAIHARAEGVQPRRVDLLFETEDGQSGREAMVSIGRAGEQTFRHIFRNAQQSLTFHLVGGDDRTETYEVKLVDRPEIVSMNITLHPPAYTKLPDAILADGQRSADYVAGTVVSIDAKTNKLIAEVKLMNDREQVATVEPQGDSFLLRFEPTRSTSYHFALVDEVGLTSKKPSRIALRKKTDDPPHVRLAIPGVGEMVTPDAVLSFNVEVSDQFGVAAMTIGYERVGENEGAGDIPLSSFVAGTTTYSDSLTWSVHSAKVAPGDRLLLVAEASDYDDISGPNVGRSTAISLRVVTREELLAELARREREYRMDFERLVDSQESLRGMLLTVLRQHQQGNTHEELAAGLVSLDRRQRSIISSVGVIRRQFQQILAELRTNQLNTTDEEDRLGDGIIPMLSQLTNRGLPTAADAIRAWSRLGTKEAGLRVDPSQIDALDKMRAILQVMVQWEGYQEMVTMLRDMIRLQGELKSETLKTMENESEDVFED